MDFDQDSHAVVEKVDELHMAALKHVVATPAQYEETGAILLSVKAAAKDLAARKKLLLDPARKTIAEINALFAVPEKRLEDAQAKYEGALSTYRRAEKEKADIAQRKLEETARKERERAEKAAADAQAKALEARQAGDEKRAAKYETKAELATERAATTVAPLVTADLPQVKGLSTREAWSARVDNLFLLVKAVAAGEVPLSYVVPNDKILNAQARTLKRQFVCPGVSVHDRDVMVGRSTK